MITGSSPPATEMLRGPKHLPVGPGVSREGCDESGALFKDLDT